MYIDKPSQQIITNKYIFLWYLSKKKKYIKNVSLIKKKKQLYYKRLQLKKKKIIVNHILIYIISNKTHNSNILKVQDGLVIYICFKYNN